MTKLPQAETTDTARTAGILTYENRVVLILTIAGGVASLDLLAFNFLSPFIATELKLTSGQIGMIGGISLLAWSVGAIAAALFSDRVGRRRIFLVLALIGFGLMSTGTALAVSFATLLIARLLVGLCEGPVMPIESAIMYSESSPHRRGLNMGIVQSFGSQLIGAIVGPLVLIAIATNYGWREAFVVAAVPALIMALVVQFGIRETKIAASDEPRPSAWQSVRSVIGIHNIRICFLIGAVSIAWLTMMSIFIPLWMIREMHYSPTSMSIVMACMGIGGTIGAIVAPALSDRLGRRPVLIAFTVFGVLLPAGLLLAPPTLFAVCAIGLVGRLFSGIFPLFMAIIPTESVDARRSATALSVLLGGAQITGGLIGPVLAGILSDRISPAAPFWMAMLFAACAGLFGLFLHETAPARAQYLS